MSVDLRRRQALVAEQFLNAAEVRSTVEQMRGEAVPEGVGRCDRVEACLFEILLQHTADAAGGQPASELVEKHRVVLFASGRLRHADVQPAVEGLGSVRANGGDALLPSFAEHAHDVCSPIPIRHVESHQLRHAQTGGVQRLQNGPVPQTHR